MRECANLLNDCLCIPVATCPSMALRDTGGLGAYSGSILQDDTRAWASTASVAIRPDGTHVSIFQIGATKLMHLEAKPVGMGFRSAMHGSAVSSDHACCYTIFHSLQIFKNEAQQGPHS